MTDRDELLNLLPQDGSPVSNSQLLKRLGWGKQKYFEVQQALVAEGVARKSRGRGGRLELVVNEDHAKMLAKIPADGSSIGNITLRKKLRWGAKRYWAVRDALLDAGVIVKGGGKGGSVSRLAYDLPSDDDVDEDPEEVLFEAEEEVEEEDEGSEPRTYDKEADLYPVIGKVLRGAWSSDQRLHKNVVEITANQGGKRTGGKWTRPDLTLIGLREYELTALRVVDVVTFEVKPAGCWDIAAVYEASAQSRAATHSYVFLHLNEGDEREELMRRFESECLRLGLGLITSTAPHSFENWDLRVEALRQNSDPDAVEEFLKTQVSAKTLETVKRWHQGSSR